MPSSDTLYRALLEASGRMPIIDTHEHLPPESVRVAQNVSFTDLFYHYCIDDFMAAGMPGPDTDRMYAADTPVEEKWRLFAPYYRLIRNGSYTRAGRIAMQRFYDVQELNTLEDAALLTERMRAANQPGIYQRVLQDACHIEKCMLFTNNIPKDALFGEVWNVEPYTEIASLGTLQGHAQELGGLFPTLSGYADALGRMMQALKARGVRGIKFPTAYNRDLNFDKPVFAEAEAVYNRIFSETVGRRPFPISYAEMRPLQNYLVNVLAQAAGEVGLAVVFHTGIQTGMRNVLDNARPERLWSLFNLHRNTRFVLLHAGLPWIRECLLLAKYFPNVFVDLAWVHIISPEIARDAIRTYIDVAPMNKLLGFGGDYIIIEPVYGHLQLARENIARALSERVLDGALSEDDAYAWQKAMLYENAKAVYRL